MEPSSVTTLSTGRTFPTRAATRAYSETLRIIREGTPSAFPPGTDPQVLSIALWGGPVRPSGRGAYAFTYAASMLSSMRYVTPVVWPASASGSIRSTNSTSLL